MARRRVTNFNRPGFPSYEEVDEEGQAKPCVYGVSWVNEDTLRTITRHGVRCTGPKGQPLSDADLARSREVVDGSRTIRTRRRISRSPSDPRMVPFSDPREGARYVEALYCLCCGGSLAVRVIKPGEPARAVCTRCRFVHYADPKLAVGVICAHGGGVLLLRRGIRPGYGKWVFPGGYVDRGERTEEAARREVREEVCIDVRVGAVVNVYSYVNNPVVLIVYEGQFLSGTPRAGDETLEVRAFSPAEVPWADLAFPSTRESLRDYFDRR